jgi:GMP reductase
MSSAVAMNKHSGGVADYRSSEGKAVILPYKGPVKNTVNDILGGIRSSCTYVGASKLKELPKRTC